MDADGLHVGQEDAAQLDLAAVRARLGPRVLGISTGGPGEARAALAAGADYVGIGPMFATGSKLDAGPAIGAQGVEAVVRSVTIPVVAIGGITLERLPEVRATGAAMAAVISALAGARDPVRAARAMHDAWAAAGAR
jgi:thiamine-phosphate pyrophosphorylase